MDEKGQLTISNILGVSVILFVLFALRGAFFDALATAFSSSDALINKIPYVTFPAFFIIIIIMLVFYDTTPRFERRVTR